MTFSIIVRESIDGDESYRYGVGVTTNNPGIGLFAPFVSEHGAVAAQYETHGDVGTQVRQYLDDGVRADDAVPAAIRSSPREDRLQLHALGEDTRGYHHGSEIDDFHDGSDLTFDERSGDHWSCAGNCLASEAVLDAVANAYTSADDDRPLAARLIDALAAGDEAGGDGRDNDARSAAVRVVDPTAGVANEWYNDLRVDASTTPLTDLRDQFDLAKSFHETNIGE